MDTEALRRILADIEFAAEKNNAPDAATGDLINALCDCAYLAQRAAALLPRETTPAPGVIELARA